MTNSQIVRTVNAHNQYAYATLATGERARIIGARVRAGRFEGKTFGGWAECVNVDVRGRVYTIVAQTPEN